jgi:putative ABC transport system ATP-binding protein
VLCDEPTASLDKDSFAVVMEELKALAKQGKSVAVVTHDPRLQKYADRAVEVKNGFVTPLALQEVNFD